METIKITREQFVEVISNYKKGGQWVCVSMDTIPTMNKGRGSNLNPYIGRVRKLSIAQYKFNADYERGCQNRQKRMGLEPSFKAEAMKGKVWLVPNKVEQSVDGLTNYMRLYVTPNCKVKVRYMVDNREATAEEIAEIKSWTPKKSYSKKQFEAGIPEDEQLEVRSPKIESIVYVTMGHTRYILED